MGIFTFNSPFMAFLTKAVNYMLLNLLALACCVPVITVGASMTAKYYVALKMARGEEPTILKPFFKAFKENFKKATIIWLIELAVMVLFIFDWHYIMQLELDKIGKIIQIALLVLTIFCTLAGLAVFPLLARYEMKVLELIKAAFIFAFLHPFKMLFVAFWFVIPYILCLKYPNWLVGIWPVVTIVGLLYNSGMFMREFKKVEAAKNKAADKDEDGNPLTEEVGDKENAPATEEEKKQEEKTAAEDATEESQEDEKTEKEDSGAEVTAAKEED